MTSLEDTSSIQTLDPVSSSRLRQRRHRHATNDGNIASAADSKEADTEAEATAELERQALTEVLDGTSSRSVSKCFVVSALVVFGFVFMSSIPNILSANSRAMVHSGGKEKTQGFAAGKGIAPSSPHASAPPSTTAEKPIDTFYRHSHLPDPDTVDDLSSVDVRSLYQESERLRQTADSISKEHALHRGQEASNPSLDTRLESNFHQKADHVSPQPPPAGSIPATTPFQPPHEQRRETQQYKQASITQSTAWRALATIAKFSLRVIFWSLQMVYYAFAYVVINPLMAVFIPICSFNLETAYEIVRNIIRAFLPVYTFFSAAAIIGVCVG
ncbi:hypothetical protein DFQ27_009805, partial [Actinomortierella ambigua]